MKDFQKSKVYEWDWATAGEADLPIICSCEADRLCKSVYEDLGLTANPPRVFLSDRYSYSWYQSGEIGITVAHYGGIRADAVLHELAHAILDVTGWNVPAHGKEFMGLVIRLYVDYIGLSRSHLIEEALVRGIYVDLNFNPI